MFPASHLESRQLWNLAGEQVARFTKQSDPFSISFGLKGTC